MQTRKRSKKKVDKIAIGIGHKLKKMIDDLISRDVLDKGILEKKYGDLNYAGGGKIIGENCIEILEKVYLECRYPVPTSISEKYPLSKYREMEWDPIASSEPQEFACEVGLEIIKKNRTGL